MGQVKQGAESMLAKYDSNGPSHERKLHQEAQLMLEDARRKIEYIRMQQLRLRNLKSDNTDGEGDLHGLNISC
jgi:Hr1 repeat